jgi:ABC-type Fe3+-hydroxamate transport system substrate-binding protein
MRLRHLAFAAFTALLLVGCTAPTSSSDAPKTTAAETAQQPVEQATPQPVAPTPTPNAQIPEMMERAPTIDASNPKRSCKTNSDCAVKDVGNCCGTYPMCVSKDAKTDPAAVRAQCAKDGMASVCGFQEVSGCQCVKGQCENISNGAAVM